MRLIALLAVCVAFCGLPRPASAEPTVATFCSGLRSAVVSQVPGAEGMFVRSYQPATDESKLPDGLSTTAFVYDNALAVIGLVACGDVTAARSIGNALSRATQLDRSFDDGRIRNAYRAGPVGAGPPKLPGWWDNRAQLWAEDPAQDGTSTGNVAWAALALLTLHEATGDAQYLHDAARLVDWIIASTSCADSGFCGGYHGYDPDQVRLTWSSTEHNADIGAASRWLYRLTHDQRYADADRRSQLLVGRAFQNDHFLLGTKPDASLADDRLLALDVQLWPWMARNDAPAAWRRALGFAEAHLAVDGGFDFNGDRDGVWVEGTAQAALAYRITGDLPAVDRLLGSLASDQTASGLLNATRKPQLTTGLSIDPTSSVPDFLYFRRPHLGATAWAVLAATGWNPFTGRKVN
ncbi:hypothetical protein ACE103_29745 [Bradyrhizobium sp. ma5]|uniref:hypothetical protein n=1 Tax=Bradyrhizobium sp. ma5 TaxID=3344828 RepID=UPI0035D4D986